MSVEIRTGKQVDPKIYAYTTPDVRLMTGGLKSVIRNGM